MLQRGFTLYELLITLLVIAILYALGVPSFSQQVQANRTRTAMLDLLESINHTRTLAVAHGTRATLRHRGQWIEGWEVFIDSNNNGLQDEEEAVVAQRKALAGVKISGNRPLKNYLSFVPSGESRYASNSKGGAFQAGTFTICPLGRGEGYELVLSRGGRARMQNLSAAECDEK